MAASAMNTDFVVWGTDQTAYGPVELPTLVSWIKDQRITADTWVFVGKTGAWQKAAEVPELGMFFSSGTKSPAGALLESARGVDPCALRRLKILDGMTDEQLERFARFAELERVPQWSVIVRQGDPGNAMYLILEGELRVRVSVMGNETVLTTLGVGDFLGDISLFNEGPRSADVVANTDSLLVKISSVALDALCREAPDLATPFLRTIDRTLSPLIHAGNKGVGGSEGIARAAG